MEGTFCQLRQRRSLLCQSNRPLTLTVSAAGFSRDQLVLTAAAEVLCTAMGLTSCRWYPVMQVQKTLSLATSGTIGEQIQVSGTVDAQPMQTWMLILLLMRLSPHLKSHS